jgi:hypothetical protein
MDKATDGRKHRLASGRRDRADRWPGRRRHARSSYTTAGAGQDITRLSLIGVVLGQAIIAILAILTAGDECWASSTCSQSLRM